MSRLHFTIERSIITSCHDAAILLDSESTTEALTIAMWNAVRLDVKVTIEGVTMPAACWEDPEHWADDWVTELDIEHDEVPEAVAALLAGAITEGT